MTSNKKILTIRNLTKVYPSGVRALNKVSLEVNEGEFLVIIGLSGSGKSTLLRCVNRLLEPSSGEIDFNGQDIAKFNRRDTRRLRQQIAMIFQQFNLVPRYTVVSQVLMGRLAVTPTWKSLLGMFSKQDRKAAMDYLTLVGIDDKARIRADQLSGGQQQRVAIARALAQQPKILLADEPVASLDPATCHTVMDYLQKVNRELGITIICNLHFLSLVRQYATRVVALKAGEIVYQGSPQDITEEWFQKIYGDEAKEVLIK